MVIAVDFDDTIHDSKNIPHGQRMGPPIEGAINALRTLKRRGNTIVIFTARGNQLYVRQWLRHYNVPFDGVTNVKQPSFKVMVDNRGLRFEGAWNRTLTELAKLGA